ncbi:hypothetical protein [Acinetobacter sp. ANC 4641]|uniref:hypothetical protein n=1 Tax=Acinetobacter sp. ANC 4641 TaxID=2529847 RepID=UPI00103EF0AF|nr:hypothetical protein [Acinetobacter sp. ANC 4641]TCB11462.1 hypothetical protein E0H78_07465 [Acinetobacter sp. ANC 4641]
MKSNLAHKHEPPQAELVQFPKKERQVMSDKEDGYTPLPNFICDEGYLAVLDGDAVKCLLLLNRHVNGFHLKNKGMSEALIKKITGIKDGRTIQKYMAQLAKYKLIKIEKSKGKSNVYTLTFEDRLPTQYVGAFDGSAQNVPTCHVPTPPTCDVGGSTYMACRSVKEIDLKENIKNDEEDTREKFQPQNRMLNFVMYHTDDQKFYKLVELAQTYPVDSDFIAQAQVSFPNLNLDRITSEFKKLCQWSLAANGNNPQKWMTTWLNWLSNLTTEKPQAAKQQFAPKPNSRNVNDPWGEPKHYAPASDIDTGDYL